ncbi:MAG: hypothetical protein ACE5K9_06850 [Candidatus Methylomirabilales bacterium]
MDRVFTNEGGFEDKEIGIIRSTLKWRVRPELSLDESREGSARIVPSDRAKVKEEKVA